LASASESEQRQPDAGIVALIKPQFEAGRQDVARGRGVIRAAEIHAQVLRAVLEFAQAEGLGARGLLRSPLLGPKGNAEFLVWLDPAGQPPDTDSLLEEVTSQAKKSPE
jgi:23S rRNA (cytidine1920-2'-O)/16S rRNA (cytidine1409-2'-O)-methyltransferase